MYKCQIRAQCPPRPPGGAPPTRGGAPGPRPMPKCQRAKVSPGKSRSTSVSAVPPSATRRRSSHPVLWEEHLVHGRCPSVRGQRFPPKRADLQARICARRPPWPPGGALTRQGSQGAAWLGPGSRGTRFETSREPNGPTAAEIRRSGTPRGPPGGPPASDPRATGARWRPGSNGTTPARNGPTAAEIQASRSRGPPRTPPPTPHAQVVLGFRPRSLDQSVQAKV